MSPPGRQETRELCFFDSFYGLFYLQLNLGVDTKATMVAARLISLCMIALASAKTIRIDVRARRTHI